jgi:hypothetical protein
MSAGLIAIVGFMYAAIAAEQFIKGNPCMGLIFVGYSLSNVGFYFAAR